MDDLILPQRRNSESFILIFLLEVCQEGGGSRQWLDSLAPLWTSVYPPVYQFTLKTSFDLQLCIRITFITTATNTTCTAAAATCIIFHSAATPNISNNATVVFKLK